ncbi:ABC transporter permease [Nonomuraea sp. NPDC049607]|uniref:ABC transporter permease n=1 Tax=Nonomuraea sp. NPDC049607 TaxID=3154732 RepID=UPI00342B6C18
MIRSLARLWAVPVVVALWELATRAAGNPYFPPPSTIALRLGDLWISRAALDDLSRSLGRLLTGWVVAGVAGVAAGVAMGRSPLLARFVDPAVQFCRALPPPALLPVFLALFSTGTLMQVATIACGIVWPVLINAADGARNVDRLHLDTARVFRLSAGQRLLRVVLPSAAPKILAGLRLSLSLALILMVIAEFFATDGVGFRLRAAQRSFDLPGMWAAVTVLGVLGYLLNQVFLMVERRMVANYGASE